MCSCLSIKKSILCHSPGELRISETPYATQSGEFGLHHFSFQCRFVFWCLNWSPQMWKISALRLLANSKGERSVKTVLFELHKAGCMNKTKHRQTAILQQRTSENASRFGQRTRHSCVSGHCVPCPESRSAGGRRMRSGTGASTHEENNSNALQEKENGRTYLPGTLASGHRKFSNCAKCWFSPNASSSLFAFCEARSVGSKNQGFSRFQLHSATFGV